MQLGYLASVADVMKLSGRGADWLAGGSRVLREAEVPHPCGYVRETVQGLAAAHPKRGCEHERTTPNRGFDGELIQQPRERETEPAHWRRRMKRLNQPCADRFSPDASQTHDCKIRELRS